MLAFSRSSLVGPTFKDYRAIRIHRSLSVVASSQFNGLSKKARSFVEECTRLCQPSQVHVCDGSERENETLIDVMRQQGMLEPLPKMENCWLARTDPADVARVESRTFVVTPKRCDAVPNGKDGIKGQLGNWMSPDSLQQAIQERFPSCMKGRTMYVIPFSMGPVGSPLSKIGIEVTDSPYVAASMRIMTRVGSRVLESLGENDFVRCLHSVGRPLPISGPPVINNWPCNPERTIIIQCPETNEIISFGSGYGGNSLLGKKCFALRIGSVIAKKEGWLAEHMLILGITNPQGKKSYIAAAFPSACGKTNLAMLTSTLPGYKVECVGDDIAWLRFDQEGRLRAINPENGFFGVAPGTNYATNPNAMKTIQKNTIFTNVAKTSDGGVFWEGLEKEVNGSNITSWLGESNWSKSSGKPAAHPNSRFCAPASQCPIIDPAWEDPEGVPIDAILFGGRRPRGVPLVYEAMNWKHGVFIGASVSSEATAAAEHKGRTIMHDPFAMRPFFGYNAGHYLDHWLSMEKPGRKLPKIFHVNWFRRSEDGRFLWPGFGENSRVLEWVLKRCEGADVAQPSPIGFIPKQGSLNTEGLKDHVDWQELFSLPKDFWQAEVADLEKYFGEQFGNDFPNSLSEELQNLKQRVDNMQ